MIKSRIMRWIKHVSLIGEMRSSHNTLAGKRERKKPLGRPGRRLEGNIKMDVREIGWESVDWMDVAQNRDHGNETLGFRKGEEFLGYFGVVYCSLLRWIVILCSYCYCYYYDNYHYHYH
jgi:hypothetical protein